MLHDVADVVLPGMMPIGKPCPGCDARLPWEAGGFADAARPFRRPTVEEAYQAAVDGNRRLLDKFLTPGRYAAEHAPVVVGEGDQERDVPCRFDGWPSWLLAHCRRPEDVDAWVKKLEPWWTPPAPNGQ